MEGHIDQLGQFAYCEAPDMHLIVEPLELPWELSLFLAKNAAPYLE